MRWLKAMILGMVLSSSLGLVGCNYGLPPGGWKTPVESTEETSNTPPRPLPDPSKPTDPLALKTRRVMIQVLRKLTDQRAAWLEEGREYGRLPVGTLDWRDPWGNEYRVWPEIRNGSKPHRMGVVLVLASAGPDGQFATHDDIQEESDDLLPGQAKWTPR